MNSNKKTNMTTENIQTVTFGAGCFWCTEAIFQEVAGVHEVFSGYSGGATTNPTYYEVCSGTTGHAEVVQITYDPSIISYEELLIIFMTTHNPTSLNRQGADRGTQYRSIILYQNTKEKEIAETVLTTLQPYFDKPIVTEIAPLNVFYKAEEGHQNYYRSNTQQGYCQVVIDPKLAKFRKLYADKLKKTA